MGLYTGGNLAALMVQTPYRPTDGNSSEEKPNRIFPFVYQDECSKLAHVPFSPSDKSMKASWWVRSRVERNPAGWIYWCCKDCSSFRFSLLVFPRFKGRENGRGSMPKR